ncbi:MAG TPA: ATP-binding protein [Armatimonadota bacterium]|jgi:signal transduction histidine kinase
MHALAAISTLAAVALGALLWRARQERRTLLRRSMALRTLYDVGKALSGTLDFEALLQSIMELSRDTIGSATASVMLADERSGDLVLVCSHGLPDDAKPGARIASDGSVAQWVYVHSEPVMLQGDPSDDSRFEIAGARQHIHSALCVPLVGPRGPVGVLSLNNSVHGAAFTQEDLDLLTSIGVQAGIAVANARLHAHVETANRQLTVTVEHLRNLKSCLTSMTSANLDESLTTMLDAAVEGTGALSGSLTALDQGNVVHRLESPKSAVSAKPFNPLEPIPAGEDRPSHGMLRVLMAEGESIGLLKLVAPSDGAGFNDDDREFVDALVEHASVVVFNSMLYQQAEAGRKALQQALAELQEKQDQLIQSEKLAAIGQLAAKVCHEINNPLTAISGCGQLMQRRLRDETGPNREAYARYLDTITSETERCSRITGELLQFARKQEPHMVEVDLHDTLNNALHLITYQHPTGLDVQTHIDPSTPRVVADPQQITQVLLNLFNNAAQAMPEGGALEVSSTYEPGAETVCIVIRDHGAGLSDEAAQQVFSPFYTTKSTGTGLGLAISRGIVEKHRGTLDLENAEGGGAVATVRLPVRQKPPASPEPRTPA